MGQGPRQSALIDAVRAFDAELEHFSRAAAAACRRSLDSKRELEKATAAVTEAAGAEVALQGKAQDLLAALRSAQAEQQSRAEALRARANEIKERVEVYEGLANRYHQLGIDGALLAEAAGKLNLSTRPGGDQPFRAELLTGLDELERRVSDLRGVARTLAADARTAGFEDLATESHAVEQTLSSLRNKLLLARQAAALTSPPGDA
jgi:DNA repair exonuclease SbcCD ATPase subunit